MRKLTSCQVGNGELRMSRTVCFALPRIILDAAVMTCEGSDAGTEPLSASSRRQIEHLPASMLIRMLDQVPAMR